MQAWRQKCVTATPASIAAVLTSPLPAPQPPLVETRINCPLSLMQTFWWEAGPAAACARHACHACSVALLPATSVPLAAGHQAGV